MYKDEALAFFTYLYRRDILETHKITFSEDVRYGEDSEFLWKYLCHLKSVISFDAPIYYYRLNENSAMHHVTWAQTDAIRSTERSCNYLESMGFPLSEEFHTYMPARMILSVAKTFAFDGQRSLFDKLDRCYSLRNVAKKLIGKNGIDLTAAAMALLVSPDLFFYSAEWLSKIRMRMRRKRK